MCLALVIGGLALESAPLILALVPIGVIAGWTRRHPFDCLWNDGLTLVAVCGLVTATNFCIPSTLLGFWWRRRDARTAAA